MTLNQPFPSYPNLTQGSANLPLVAQGSGALPTYQTLQVPGGGTGNVSVTAYAPICGGTTSTSALQSTASVGTLGQVLCSNGAGALPAFAQFPLSTHLTNGSSYAPSSATAGLFTGSGSILSYTPSLTGRLWGTVSCTMSNAAGSANNCQARYGTGTAPATGTHAGSGTALTAFSQTSGGAPTNLNYATQSAPFLVTGLSVGTPYWFDYTVSMGTNAALNTIYNLEFVILEG
jgi:hypothetical protein